jgi:hypothetical protein
LNDNVILKKIIPNMFIPNLNYRLVAALKDFSTPEKLQVLQSMRPRKTAVAILELEPTSSQKDLAWVRL